jgi:para-aminobenzoate synthetase component 1
MTIQEFTAQMNTWGREKVPFLFIVDFEMKKPILFQIDKVDPTDILFDINDFSNGKEIVKEHGKVHLDKKPVTIEEYRKKFDKVYDHLNYGDSYLTNLTVKTAIAPEQSLKELFYLTRAKYKLYFKDQFLVFSPEIFVQIRNGRIFSFPMKGTIDASVTDAARTILNDKKELAEHVTIVDLIRNDLSQVADHVRVNKFRYVEEINTNDKKLLQVSSEICGELTSDYTDRLGNIIVALLPAGSVTGAPKPKTVDIIKSAEMEERGYYTGVFGYFDGVKLDSGVMIRFIEKENGALVYRSGGGITTQSDVEKEYQEIIDKVYVPVD